MEMGKTILFLRLYSAFLCERITAQESFAYAKNDKYNDNHPS